jgi:hypothetical protein
MRFICWCAVALICYGFVHVASAQRSQPGYLPPGAREAGGITDLVLIYQGGAHRPPWDAEHFAPYVSWADPETSRERWLFDGFLFLELKDDLGREFTRGFAELPARRVEWEKYLDSLFAEGIGLRALDAAVADAVERIGTPPRPRRVVLTCPEPIAGQKDWGEVDGKSLDFTRVADRVVAMKWFTGELRRRWAEARFRNLTLAGYYWLPEHLNGEYGRLAKSYAAVVRAQELRFFYIPFWGAAGGLDYRKAGFDAAYLQPNHYFDPKVPDSRLTSATAAARQHRLGMELEWDGLILSETKRAIYLPRLLAYLDTYETESVFTHAALAHYEGGGAFYRLSKTEDHELLAVFARYCRLVADRQKREELAALSD